jgi:hypothetical protein
MLRIAWRRTGRNGTGDTPSHSRGMNHPSFSNSMSLFQNRGRREDRAPAGTHGPRAEKKHAAEPQAQPKSSGLPCAMVLRLIRDLPGDQALLPPLPRVISRNVTPTLGRQDHTTSPSASCCSSHSTSRPSHPALNVRDDRDTPLLWARDARMLVLICPTTQAKMCTTGSLRMGLCVRATLSHRHSGATRSGEPGIHNHDQEYGFRACALRRIPE